MLREGDKITFPDPNEPGTIANGTFCEVVENEPIDGQDVAWVRYSEGECEGLTAKVPVQQIKRAAD